MISKKKSLKASLWWMTSKRSTCSRMKTMCALTAKKWLISQDTRRLRKFMNCETMIGPMCTSQRELSQWEAQPIIWILHYATTRQFLSLTLVRNTNQARTRIYRTTLQKVIHRMKVPQKMRITTGGKLQPNKACLWRQIYLWSANVINENSVSCLNPPQARAG